MTSKTLADAVKTIRQIFEICQYEPGYSGTNPDARRLDDCVSEINEIADEFLHRDDVKGKME